MGVRTWDTPRLSAQTKQCQSSVYDEAKLNKKL